MARFELVQRCWPTGSFRSSEVATFLSLLAKSCGVSRFETSSAAGPFDPTSQALEALFRAAEQEAPFPGAGADVDLHGRIGGTDEYIRCDFHTGTKPGELFIDHYNVDFGGSGLRINAGEFRRAIEMIGPFEAFLAELNNEHDLDAYTRQRQVGLFKAPAIIRCLHYFDDRMASQVGGIDRCLRAPAHKVERFLNGVLVDLVGDAFDPTDAAHLETQRRVMEHLGMHASPTPIASGVVAEKP